MDKSPICAVNIFHLTDEKSEEKKKKKLDILPNGNIGRFGPGNHLLIEAELPAQDGIVLPVKMGLGRIKPYHVSRGRGETPPRIKQRVYVKVDGTQPGKQKPFLDNKSLAIRLVELKRRGQLAIWSLGLAVQNDNLFVVCQQNYQESFFRKSGAPRQLVCPKRESSWPALCEFVRRRAPKSWAQDAPSLPRDWTKSERVPIIEEVLADNEARVVWWDSLLGFGVARIAALSASRLGLDRDVAVKRQQLGPMRYTWYQGKKVPSLKNLDTGQVVSFKRLEKMNKPRNKSRTDRADRLVARAELKGVHVRKSSAMSLA